jgi:hypothetical protein
MCFSWSSLSYCSLTRRKGADYEVALSLLVITRVLLVGKEKGRGLRSGVVGELTDPSGIKRQQHNITTISHPDATERPRMNATPLYLFEPVVWA